MYEIRDRQDPVKGSGWALFPSTMAEQPIQKMVVGHLCFQERAEQLLLFSMYVCMYVCLLAVVYKATRIAHLLNMLKHQDINIKFIARHSLKIDMKKRGGKQARSHNEANEAVASPKISKKNLPQMKNS